MNNKILRTASLQLVNDPNNIVKVAGMLSKIKRWVLNMFSPSARKQIGIIDSKYSEIKGLIEALQNNILAIEDSIDKVDIAGYDYQVKELSKILSVLSKKLITTNVELKKQTETKGKTLEQEKIETPVVETEQSMKDFFKVGSTLGSLDVPKENIFYSNPEKLYNSMKGVVDGQTIGNGNALKFFNGDVHALNDFIFKMKENEVVAKSIIPDIRDKYVIQKVTGPISKQKPSRLINTGTIQMRGISDAYIDDKLYNIIITMVLDVFVHNADEIEDYGKYGLFRVSKQYVWGLRLGRGKHIEREEPKAKVEEEVKSEAKEEKAEDE